MFHKYVIPYFIGLNTFVNNIFRAVILTLPYGFTGEDFVVSSAEWIGRGGLSYTSGKG